MSAGRGPDLKRALRPVPTDERAVREVSRMLADLRAAVRQAAPEHLPLLERLFDNADRTR